jgi:hypothetical protein
MKYVSPFRKSLKLIQTVLLRQLTLPKCKYAITSVSGDLNLVGAATNYLFDNWLINSSYECEPQHALEVFLDKENICNWNHFDLELCIPVKALKKNKNEKSNRNRGHSLQM